MDWIKHAVNLTCDVIYQATTEKKQYSDISSSRIAGPYQAW